MVVFDTRSLNGTRIWLSDKQLLDACLQICLSSCAVSALRRPVSFFLLYPSGFRKYVETRRAFNYGAMGSIIGHEVMHGFDNLGKDYDTDGNMRRWLSDEWQKKFDERARCFVKQYDNTSVLLYTDKGAFRTYLKSNGTLTLSENLADYGGLQLAFKLVGDDIRFRCHGTQQSGVFHKS
ncbi:hypothetical protein Y032_0311g2142 [Ancylostoma ceylanicum]|uniref:Peptidase M13 C-terminal domain-containing protein n=3 Tax=Ancylostoma ceylanicum TaxID=53326 RepID=A0A016S237_9BILA|nr:hypothetical protein Y032_0311g2142 [Ancylostoma ceylanicum]